MKLSIATKVTLLLALVVVAFQAAHAGEISADNEGDVLRDGNREILITKQ